VLINELDAAFHELRGEGYVAGEPVELGDDALGPELSSSVGSAP